MTDRFDPSRSFRSTMQASMGHNYNRVLVEAVTRVTWRETLQATETIRYESSRTASTKSKLRIRKVWYTMRDARVRRDHQKVHGKSRFVDHRGWKGAPGRFNVGGESLRFPRDPQGSAGQTYNCRCWLEYRKVRPKA